jgi:hypothetical protein
MRTNSMIVLASCLLIVAATCFSVPTNSQTTQPERPVLLKDIAERGVEGRLGVRLGTIVEAAGEVVANTSRAMIDADVPFFLQINTVDGRDLDKPVLYRFDMANQWVKVKTPKIGDSFRYAGYETGGFGGSPAGEFDYVGEYATTGYGFATRFAILGANGKVKK